MNIYKFNKYGVDEEGYYRSSKLLLTHKEFFNEDSLNEMIRDIMDNVDEIDKMWNYDYLHELKHGLICKHGFKPLNIYKSIDID